MFIMTHDLSEVLRPGPGLQQAVRPWGRTEGGHPEPHAGSKAEARPVPAGKTELAGKPRVQSGRDVPASQMQARWTRESRNPAHCGPQGG